MAVTLPMGTPAIDTFATVPAYIGPGAGFALGGSFLFALAGMLGILGFFKYGNFLLENWVALMALVGVDWQAPGWDIVLPVGISFYTFQTMAYSLDIYLKRAEPAKSFLDFALFVTFFPQLVAGPIERGKHLLPQFRVRPRTTASDWREGAWLIAWGLYKKVVIADNLNNPKAIHEFKNPPGE